MKNKHNKIVGMLICMILFTVISYYIYLFFVNNNQQRLSSITSIISFSGSSFFIIYQTNKSRKNSIETAEFSQKRKALTEIGYEILNLKKSFSPLNNSFILMFQEYKELQRNDYPYKNKKELGIVKDLDSTIHFTDNFFMNLNLFNSECSKVIFELSMNDVSKNDDIYIYLNRISDKIKNIQKEKDALISDINCVIHSFESNDSSNNEQTIKLKKIIESLEPIECVIEDLNNLTKGLDRKIKKTINSIK